MIKLSIFLLSMLLFLNSCSGDDANLLLASKECSKVVNSQFNNSLFQNNGSAELYNEWMKYKYDGTVIGSGFSDSVITAPKNESADVLQAYGAFNSTIHCISEESGLITYSLYGHEDELKPLGHFALSNCSFKKISGNTYKFHADFIAGANPDDSDQNIKKYKGYIKPKGLVEFTCDNK